MCKDYREYLVSKINDAYQILSLTEELATNSSYDISKIGRIAAFINGIIWRYNQQLSKYDYEEFKEQSKKEIN